MITLEDSNIRKFIAENDKCLIMFGAVWCGPCKMLKPKLSALNRQDIGYIEVDQTSVSTTLDIRAVPTLVCFRDGKVVLTSHSLSEEVKNFLIL